MTTATQLHDLLPAPSAVTDEWNQREDPWFKSHEAALVAKKAFKEPPPYGKRSGGWMPRAEADYGDGGAFPEIQMAQYPMGMGRTKAAGAESKVLALQVNSEGKVNFDAIARVGHEKDKVVYSKLSDTKGRVIDDEDESLQKPSDESVMMLTEQTRMQIEEITQTKVAAALPVRHAEKQAPAEYIRYTPSQQGPGFASGAQQRIIRMVEAQPDPMEPPKFKINQKIPRAPPSPPAPVMHSPTRKVTAKEQTDWKVPPCISNWKNPKGYTIPLDKRLAADGRGLQQVHINENFAKLAEALYIADRKAREAVEMRATLERRLAQKKKEDQEEKMRDLARKAREERQGIRQQTRKGDEKDNEEKERDEIRRERQNDRRRDRNIARAAPDKQAKLRTQVGERDISEKIALGLPDTRARNDETQFDERLFNQSKGLDSGGGLDDETYAVYDKPWRGGDNVSKHIYRPSKNVDKDIYGDDLDKLIKTNKFVPDKGFEGSDPSVRRDGPVQFEREEDDPFGLGQLLDDAKKGKKTQSGAGSSKDRARHREDDRDGDSKRQRR